MQDKISRRKLAEYVADSIEDGTDVAATLEQLAGYLIDSRRTRELDLIVRTTEAVLAERGTVIARVTSARALNDAVRKKVESQIHANRVIYEEIIDRSIIGGVRIETPGQLLDATMKRKLLTLRQAKQ